MLKKMILSVAAILAIALVPAVPAQAGTIPASIVPESARWIIHLDMEKFVATKLYGFLDQDGTFEIRSQNVERWLKIDVTKDVTGVTVIGLEPGGKAVVAVSGRFDKAQLLNLLALEQQHKEMPYGAFTIHSTDDDEYGAFVNDGLIVLAETREAIEKVLDTAGGKAKNFAGSGLSAALKDIPSGAFLSGVLPDLSGLGKEINRSKVLEKASGLFFLAQEKQDILLFRLQVTADSPESAKNMADVVQGLIAMGRLGEGQGEMAGLRALVEGLQVKLEGKVVRLDLERPSREIADLISHRKALGGLLD